MYHLRCRIWRWISDRRSVPYLLHVSIRIWDLERRSGRTLGPVWDPTVGVSRRHESRRTRTFQSSHFARDIRSTASERPSWRQEHRSRTQNAPREWGVFFVFFLRTQINQRSRSNLRTRSARAQQLAPMHTQPSHVRRHAASRTYFASLPCQCSLSPSSPYLHLSERKERDASLLRILEHHLLSTRAAPPPFRQVPCSWRT